MAGIEVLWNRGYVSSRDRADLESGELVQASGCWYKPGDRKRLWQQKGATEFDDLVYGAGASSILGVGLTAYDDGTELVISYAGTTLYESTAGLTGTLDTLTVGLDASATKHSLVHSNDRWFWCNGFDRNLVIKADKSLIFHGMQAPQSELIATPSTGTGDLTRPVSDGADLGAGVENDFLSDPNAAADGSFAYDTDDDTFTYGSLSAAGTLKHNWTFASKDLDGYQLNIRYALAGPQNPLRQTPDGSTGGSYGVGGTIHGGFDVDIQIQYREDGGAWVTLVDENRTASTSNKWLQISLSTTGSEVIDVRAQITYNNGTSPASLRLYTIYAQNGTDAATFALENEGLFYAYCEYDENNGHLSPPSQIIHVTVTEFGDNNQVTLSQFPTTPKNSRATHYYIYRSTDTLSVFGEPGEALEEIGWIGEMLVANAASDFLDTFAVNNVDKDTQAFPLIPMVTIGGSRGILRVAQDTPPPSFQWMGTFKGRLIGISRDFPRALFGSVTGMDHSWPEINLIDAFPFPDNDQLVACTEVNDLLLIGAKGLMLTLSDFPDVITGGGAYNAAEAKPLKGQPGLVTQYGILSFSVVGEDRAAWVSRTGIIVTNGVNAWPITDDLDWENEVTVARLSTSTLVWDEDRKLIIFSADTDDDGVNDTEWLFHMHPSHLKPRENLPPLPSIVKQSSKGRSHYFGGEVANILRLYSGDPADGKVYLEDNGTGVNVSAKTGRNYIKDRNGDRRYAYVYKLNARHTDWGTGKTGVITWGVGFDASGQTDSVANTLSLANQEGEELLVARMGEWHEVTFASTGTGLGSLLDVHTDARLMGKVGVI